MEFRKTFVIIDMDMGRSGKTLFKLKQANVKVRAVKGKSELDEIYRTGGIQALLIAPQVANDIPRLKEFYKAPIFVIGEVEPQLLPRLYRMEVTDVFSSDFNLGLLFEKLGHTEYVDTHPLNHTHKTSLFDDPMDDGYEEPIRQDVKRGRSKPQKNKPMREKERSTPPTKPKGSLFGNILSSLNKPIGKNK